MTRIFPLMVLALIAALAGPLVVDAVYASLPDVGAQLQAVAQ